jgi:broad specificity phosphatase PhoE
LSEHGVEQAEELGEFLYKIDPKIQRIYSSPFYRCIQTALPAAQKLGLEILPEPGIGEWYHPDDIHPPRKYFKSGTMPLMSPC